MEHFKCAKVVGGAAALEIPYRNRNVSFCYRKAGVSPENRAMLL